MRDWISVLETLSDDVIPVIDMGNRSMISFLQSEILEKIHNILVSKGYHGISILSTFDDTDCISDISSYTFDSESRQKNLGWHLDTIDRIESKNLRMTGLYSPVGSYSSIPTFTADTQYIDNEAKRFLDDHEKLVKQYWQEYSECSLRIRNILGGEGIETTGYYTLLQNVFFAHRQINQDTGDELLKLRDSFTGKIIEQRNTEIGSFHSQEGIASLFFFRNGLGPNRDISHTRFSKNRGISVGPTYNLGILNGGIIYSQIPPKNTIPEGLKIMS